MYQFHSLGFILSPTLLKGQSTSFEFILLIQIREGALNKSYRGPFNTHVKS